MQNQNFRLTRTKTEFGLGIAHALYGVLSNNPRKFGLQRLASLRWQHHSDAALSALQVWPASRIHERLHEEFSVLGDRARF